MKHNINIQSIPQPAAVPYWNMIKDSSREVKETLLNMLYISLKEDAPRTSKESHRMSMQEAVQYLDSLSVKGIHVPSDINGMRDMCNPKYM